MPATSAGAVGEWQSGAKVPDVKNEAVLNAVVDFFQQEVVLRQLNLKSTFGLLKFTPLAQFGKHPTSPSPEKGILSLKLTNARFQVVGPS